MRLMVGYSDGSGTGPLLVETAERRTCWYAWQAAAETSSPVPWVPPRGTEVEGDAELAVRYMRSDGPRRCGSGNPTRATTSGRTWFNPVSSRSCAHRHGTACARKPARAKND